MNEASNGLQLGMEAWHNKEYDKAFALLLPIAQQGDAEAQCIVADMYWLGWGTERNFQEALKWFLRAAEQDHPNACNTLGCIYAVGDPELPANSEVAKKWYRKVVENGFDMYDKEWVEALYK